MNVETKLEKITDNKIPNIEIAEKLNDRVFSVLSANGLVGFEKAYLIANAVAELKKLLTKEYMVPILALQGNKLGFKTDKDDKGGYPEEVVKNCLIEAVLTGVQPFGNQFNIIVGNSYITKEGFGFLLSHYKGLSYEIVPDLPRINGDKSSAAIAMNVEWTISGGTKKQKKLDIPVKMNAYMGTDAVIGKATRKARAWLYNTITGSEIADGDVVDYDAKVVNSRVNTTQAEKEAQRVELLIEDAKTLDDLSAIFDHVGDAQMDMFLNKREAIENSLKK